MRSSIIELGYATRVPGKQQIKEVNMLNAIIVILVILWLIGLLGHIAGSFIHLLLVVAVIVLIYDILAKRKKA